DLSLPSGGFCGPASCVYVDPAVDTVKVDLDHVREAIWRKGLAEHQRRVEATLWSQQALSFADEEVWCMSPNHQSDGLREAKRLLQEQSDAQLREQRLRSELEAARSAERQKHRAAEEEGLRRARQERGLLEAQRLELREQHRAEASRRAREAEETARRQREAEELHAQQRVQSFLAQHGFQNGPAGRRRR
ncbi:unnamed protein product, partial [Polarella glacialis]